MKEHTRNPFSLDAAKAAICLFLAAVLILTSPGLGCYEALASVAAVAPVAGSIGAPGFGAAGASIAAKSPGSAHGLGLGAALPRAATLPSVSRIAPTPAQGASGSVAAVVSAPHAALAGRETARTGIATPMPAKAAPQGILSSLSSRLASGILGRTLSFSPARDNAPKRRTPAPKPDPWAPVRAADELRIFFDGGRRRKKLSANAVQGAYNRKTSGMHIGMTGPAPEEIAPAAVPAPRAAAKAPGFWDSMWVKAALPAGIFTAAALFLQAELIPLAITAGALMGSILLHETAHVLGLRLWGDTAPARAGRDSLNPLSHADAAGSLLVPAAGLAVSQALTGTPVLAGWAKPVPVEFNNLRDVKKDAAKVAALGPLTNLGIASIAAAVLFGLPAIGIPVAGTTAFVLSALFKMNLALTAFHLLPLPWNDGGKLLISVLPEKLYRLWTYNPRIPPAYQGLYQRLYEGPSHALTLFGFRTTDQINSFTRAAGLAALGVFVYGLTFSPVHLPLLLLALPCSYDYWCIREKVRSEKAVEDMMDLMSQWGGLLVQIAEDHDAESEVSAFEAEHAMKNAVDQLLEDLMMKEEFRKLSDEDKIKEFMRLYPDMAVQFLKEKVMTEDSEDKIREILADERNKPMFKRLEGWLDEHKVFEKMASPHQKKHLKDEMKKKDRERASGDE